MALVSKNLSRILQASMISKAVAWTARSGEHTVVRQRTVPSRSNILDTEVVTGDSGLPVEHELGYDEMVRHRGTTNVKELKFLAPDKSLPIINEEPHAEESGALDGLQANKEDISPMGQVKSASVQEVAAPQPELGTPDDTFLAPPPASEGTRKAFNWNTINEQIAEEDRLRNVLRGWKRATERATLLAKFRTENQPAATPPANTSAGQIRENLKSSIDKLKAMSQGQNKGEALSPTAEVNKQTREQKQQVRPETRQPCTIDGLTSEEKMVHLRETQIQCLDTLRKWRENAAAENVRPDSLGEGQRTLGPSPSNSRGLSSEDTASLTAAGAAQSGSTSQDTVDADAQDQKGEKAKESGESGNTVDDENSGGFLAPHNLERGLGAAQLNAKRPSLSHGETGWSPQVKIALALLLAGIFAAFICIHESR